MVMVDSMFKPGHGPADLTTFLSFDVLDPFPLSARAFEVPNVVVVDPVNEWAAGFHGFSQDFHLVGFQPGTNGRGTVTKEHLLTLVMKNPLHGSGHPLKGRYLGRVLSAQLFEMSFSDSQDSEVWYAGKAPTNRQNYANTKLGFFRVGDRVYLSQNGNWKWQCPGWLGQFLPGDELLPRFNRTFNIPTWQQGDVQVECDNFFYWSHIPRSATGHTDHWHEGDAPPSWLPWDPDKYPVTGRHLYLPREDMTWEPDAGIMSNLPPDLAERYLQLHGL